MEQVHALQQKMLTREMFCATYSGQNFHRPSHSRQSHQYCRQAIVITTTQQKNSKYTQPLNCAHILCKQYMIFKTSPVSAKMSVGLMLQTYVRSSNKMFAINNKKCLGGKAPCRGSHSVASWNTRPII